MPKRREERTRVKGPTWIPSRQKWRVMVVAPEENRRDGRRSARWFDDETEAEEYKERVATKLGRLTQTTVGEVIELYQQHLRDKGTIGLQETIRRLRAFFPDHALPVSRVTPERARGYYDAFRQRLRPDKEPISVSYHRATLINARSMLTFCIEKGLVSANPFANVKGIGKRKRGKMTHTIDETRKVWAYCFERAAQGKEAELGVLSAFLMALRSGDLCRRLVRDVDADATQLNIHDGKTEKSNEPREIPEVLQPFYRKLVEGRGAHEPLFCTPYTADGHHTRRWLEEAMVRICEAVGVPYVCPHSLKSSAGKVLARSGAMGNQIVEHLSHEQGSTTFGHYVDRGLVEQAQAARAFAVIAGGKR